MSQQQETKTHLFGEMDLNLDVGYQAVKDQAFHIAEACGYFIKYSTNLIELYSNDYDIVKITFENDKVTKVLRSEDNGSNYEELEIKEKMFKVSPKTLLAYNSKIKYGNEKSLPMCQGMAINKLVKEYSIPAISYGYHFNLIGIETHKQFLMWRDLGYGLEFLGIINKDGSTPK